MNSAKTTKVKPVRKKSLTNREMHALLLYLKRGQINMSLCMIDAGYSKKTAGVMGSQLLKNPLAVQFLSDKVENALQKYHKTVDDLLEEVAALAFSDIGQYFKTDDNGTITLKTLTEMGTLTRAIKKIKHSKRDHFDKEGVLIYTDNVYEYELHSKIEAQKILALHHRVGQGTNNNNVLALPQIHLPDNGRTGKVAVFLEC